MVNREQIEAEAAFYFEKYPLYHYFYLQAFNQPKDIPAADMLDKYHEHLAHADPVFLRG